MRTFKVELKQKQKSRSKIQGENRLLEEKKGGRVHLLPFHPKTLREKKRESLRKKRKEGRRRRERRRRKGRRK